MHVIDAHIHTWALEDGRHMWIRDKIGALQRDFSIDTFKAQNRNTGVQGAILVQAVTEESETDELLAMYADDPFVLGVVGWVDLTSEKLVENIERLSCVSKFSGVRASPPHHFDMNWLLSEPVVRGMKVLAEKQVPIDYLVNCTQLVPFLRVFDAVPDVCAVLDHGARPFVMTGDTRVWEQDVKDLARNTNCYCKLSGLAERAGVEWNTETLKPWVAVLLETFGPERLIFASNWPIMSLMATPKIWLDSLNLIFDDLGVSPDDRSLIFQGTANSVYLRQ